MVDSFDPFNGGGVTPPVVQAPAPRLDTLSGGSIGPLQSPDISVGGIPVAPASIPGNVTNPAVPVISEGLADAALEHMLNAKVKPNLLNDFLNVGYHWRLFICEDNELYKLAGSPKNIKDVFNKLDSGAIRIVTLAETGVTTYNIKDVQFEAIIGPNNLTRNVNYTEFSITITEPMGVGFLESVKLAAESLQVHNYAKFPYYLELNFTGYKPDGTVVTNPLADGRLDSGGRWLWPLIIKDINTRLDTSGGTYTITALTYADLTFFSPEKSINFSNTPEVISPRGDTLGAMMESYQNQLNNSWRDRYGGDLVQFKIVLHPLTGPIADGLPASIRDPKTFKLKTPDAQRNPSNNLSMDNRNGTYTAKVAAGTYISDMIEYAFVNSVEGQNAALDRGTAAGQTATTSKNFRESILFRIEPEVEIRGYDHTSQNYIRTITLHVQGYYTQAIVTDTDQRDQAEKPSVQYAMIKAQIDKGFISKRYDYFYTGLNTEVTDFDVSFNMVWNVMLPKLEGARMDYDSYSANARPNTANADPSGNRPEADLSVKKVELNAVLSSLDDTNARIAASNQTQEDIKKKLALNPSAGDAAALQAQLADAEMRGDKLFDVREKQVAQAAQLRGDINRQLEASRSEITIPKGTTYAEAILEKQTTASTNAPLPLNVSFAQFYRDTSDTTGTGFVGQYTRDKSVFGSVLGQLYAPNYQMLMHVELGIRGDPFWLGKTSLERQIILRSGTASPQQSTGNPALPEWQFGDQVVLLTFRYPIRIGDAAQPVFKPDDVITSLYRVKSVKNTFANGEFKQTLSLDRLPLTEIFRAFGFAVPNNFGAGSGRQNSVSGGQASTVAGEPIISGTAVGKQAFIDAYTPYVLAQSEKTGIAPEIIMAQTALETGWGAHAPGNNYFGIKGPGQVLMTTEADANGNLVPQTQSFAGYSTPEASFSGYGNFINSNPRYGALRAAGAAGAPLADQAAALQASGYATDPNYGNKVLAIAQNLNLKRN